LKISYIHPNEMPSTAANTINVARMCDALAYDNNVRLICRGRAKATEDALQGEYGIKNNVHPLFIPNTRLLPDRAFYYLALGLHRLQRRELVYTRSILCALMAVQRGLATILELHAPVPSQPCKTTKRFQRLLTYPELRAVFANSPATLSGIQAAGEGDARLELAPHGAVPLAEVATTTRENGFTALYVGSFSRGRGIDLLLRVAKITPDVGFLLVGADQEQKCHVDAIALKQGVTNLAIQPRVTPGEIPAYLMNSDVLLAPYERQVFLTNDGSGQDYAAFMSPLKLFDYLPSGKPIVASRLASIESIIEDGVTGILCDPDVPSQWHAALMQLRSSPEMRTRLGDAARALATQKYSWSARAALVTSRAINPKV
jgi:glycosyltransferase involved in cell wall biosynthesis